tara:strand:- start:115 stop:537 length:423 start_codon:yes stop_codon:yes gene_type:complete
MKFFLLLFLPLFTVQVGSLKAEAEESLNKIVEQSKNIIILSDVQTNDNDNGVFSAIGNVKIRYPDKEIMATSDSAKYYKSDDKIVLKGNVKMIQESSHSVYAEQIVLFIDEDRIIANAKPDSQVLTKLLFGSLINDEISD